MVSDLEGLTVLDSGIGIKNLEGIQYCLNLTELGVDNSQLSDVSGLAGLTNLTHLNLWSNQLSDVTPLAGLTNLTKLELGNNQLSDVNALAGLTNLTKLELGNNQLSDVSGLAGLTNLTELELFNNQLSDVSALAGLTNLTELDLFNNQLSDVSALAGLTNLTDLDLIRNPLNTTSCAVHIPELESRGVDVAYYCETLTNSLNMTFRQIPSGTFMMGSPDDESGRDDDETLHRVTLTESFYIQTNEVTQGQWKAVMGNNPSYFSECGDNCPVEEISWNDVQEFISKMNQRGEWIYRLPTEAEWEYVARAGSSTAFSNGGITETGCDYEPNLDEIGWYCENSDQTTHPVAQKQANRGLYDMSGNVWEWCMDRYGNYPADSLTDPTGPSTGSYRVVRGGCWYSNARECRSASRIRYSPEKQSNQIGFRLTFSSSVFGDDKIVP